MQSIERVRNKVHEKTALKRSKNMRVQQDKLNKEKSAVKKNIKDTKEKICTEVAGRVKLYSKDLSSYLEQLKVNLKQGKDEVQKCEKFNEISRQDERNNSPSIAVFTEIDKVLYGVHAYGSDGTTADGTENLSSSSTDDVNDDDNNDNINDDNNDNNDNDNKSNNPPSYRSSCVVR